MIRTYREQIKAAGPAFPYRRLEVSVADRIATITLNDPETLNAFSIKMTSELRHALGALAADPDVAAIILTGSGGAFSAGGDLRQMNETEATPAERYEFIRHEFGGVIEAIGNCDKPIIAAVNGHAMGVGLFAALSCDMIVAARSARFGTAYIKLALTPLGVSFILARSLGYARAFEFCALGSVLSPEDMKGLGLVNRVVADEELSQEATIIARRLADGPPRALAFTKQILRQAAYRELGEHLMIGEAVQPLCLASDDHQEALAAFAEKRKPKFSGV
ncbi:MAG: enoyl-CoA hydratase/isomerase family protein [Sphingopyxis sp.]|nr:enoyl-CoA hydratase/isomerase family protein [Sphingopyxis sp.]